MSEILAAFLPYLPYVLGFVAAKVLDHAGIKLPAMPSPAKPGPSPLPLPPVPDGKGTFLLWLLALVEQYRAKPDSLTPAQKEQLQAAWHILPAEEPK
jgi:hypothetical protein